MRKLILKCGFSPGDLVMLTAAVRDLHRTYPGRFATDVRTACPDIWANNPFITPLSEKDPEVEQLHCTYPLINHCNETPHHCLHGFIEFLNDRLKLAIKPALFKGDIHLSAQEKAWYSQVHEVTREDIPFWVVAAGGKYDVTIKWWETERYQEVVNHFRGRVQFVQVGDLGHHHPRLYGAIDLRGKTSLRELIRLIYHSEGVLCSVTALMHLAAAVETKRRRYPHRPCVVVAGGREPPHWEAYPNHQFIHTNGALPCCANGGCWKDRVTRLRDGDQRDGTDHLCVDVVQGLPRCMEMIGAAEVIRRIELYFRGGAAKYLSPKQRIAAERGILATARNPYDLQPLNIHGAGMACERFIQNMPANSRSDEGRGIVICGGGARYFPSAWVCINMLRRTGCRLPIQLWHLGRAEMDEAMEALVKPLGVICVDASKVRRKWPVRMLRGWELKPYAILHCPFRKVLLLDADNVPLVDPAFLFDTAEFRKTGAIFWPDFKKSRTDQAAAIWRNCGLRRPVEPEFETGQIVVDKERCWRALRLCLWFNEHSDFYFKYLYGDKETFHLAFRKLGTPYRLIPHPVYPLEATMCQHDFQGRRIFQHRNMDKWDLFLRNKRIRDFRFEAECRGYVARLRTVWDGGIGLGIKNKVVRPVPLSPTSRPPKIEAVMISCPERGKVRRQTLANLARTDWGADPVHVQLDAGAGSNHQQRQMDCAYAALKAALARGADYILFLEDDLDFNRHLRHNLIHWGPVSNRMVSLASLYNPGLRDLACDARNNARIVRPQDIFGSQAFLISKAAAAYVVRHWRNVKGGQDIKISRLAGRLKNPIYYHAPSLVQHTGTKSVWGGFFHQATDFDASWKATNAGQNSRERITEFIEQRTT